MKSDNKKIPKVIHYCWFGGKPKPSLVLKCIESWKRVLRAMRLKSGTKVILILTLILILRVLMIIKNGLLCRMWLD